MELNAEQIVAALKEWNECHLPNMCIDTDGKCWQFCNDGDCVVVQAIDLIESLLDQLAERDREIERLRERMGEINNISVTWHECGPYDDANAESLKKMLEIEQLSRLPEPPGEGE